MSLVKANIAVILRLAVIFIISISFLPSSGQEQLRMDKMWGEYEPSIKEAEVDRGESFKNGNYAMFIHWGLYSYLANEYNEKTYYGIGEWIMSPRRANIPVDEYKAFSNHFNPVDFNAEAIVKLARNAGMKYIIITSKHHDGFAMYDSDVCDFNIVDATPFGRDPMKELAIACKEEGMGFGFYYSQNQDWTAPGGRNGPVLDSNGDSISFDEYFYKKCLPQVEEITTRYGDIVLIWFDTPGGMPKKYAEELMNLVHRNQSKAFVSGRIGHGMGDYKTLGDMEVPDENVDGLWEAVDVTNDSWGYAWYDENWKSPKEILKRLISTVARGGTYMLNVGPKADGTIPEYAARSLEASGHWISEYPQVIYDADPSPWGHALPWGDVTRKGNKLFLAVYEWPDKGQLALPGLKNRITSSYLLKGEQKLHVSYTRDEHCVMLDLPTLEPENFVSVIELTIEGEAVVDRTHALDPEKTTEITVHFADLVNCKIHRKRWMEKFGEWKLVHNIHKWEDNSKATWELNVIQPGDYMVDLTYAGSGRLVWAVETDEGEKIQNQQNSSHIFTTYPMGWMRFDKAGKHTVSVSLVEGDSISSELAAIRFTAIDFGDQENEPIQITSNQ